MRRSVVRGLVAAALVAATAPALAGSPRAQAAPREHTSHFGRMSVVADGQVAEGWLAYPTDITPDTLLVFAHGCCNPLDARWADFLALHHARHNGMVVVAMDYRGPKGGWNVGSGHADLIAATEALRRHFPIRRTIAWGVSMGGEVTGMAVAARPDLFDYWISSMGVLDLPTQWAQQTFRRQIEAETHGTPASARPAYDIRSPVQRAASMKGITRAYLLHGAADTAVPSSQTHQMYDRLRTARVPVSAYTITTAASRPAVWWPVYTAVDAPIGPSGHDWSTIELAQRILLAIVAGRAPDSGEPPQQHVWDGTADATL